MNAKYPSKIIAIIKSSAFIVGVGVIIFSIGLYIFLEVRAIQGVFIMLWGFLCIYNSIKNKWVKIVLWILMGIFTIYYASHVEPDMYNRGFLTKP